MYSDSAQNTHTFIIPGSFVTANLAIWLLHWYRGRLDWKNGQIDHMNPLPWRHNGHDDVSNHLPHDCLLNSLFRRRSKKTSKLRVTDLCAGNSPETGEFPAQRASKLENVSIWWRHHAKNHNISTPKYIQKKPYAYFMGYIV